MRDGRDDERLYSDTTADFHTAGQIRNMDAPLIRPFNSRLNMVSHRIIKTLAFLPSRIMQYRRKIDLKIFCITVLICLMPFLIASAYAAEGDIILGTWYDEERDAKIEIFKCAGRYCGKIIWINKPVYEPNEDSARAGTARTDDKNPNPAFRERPIVGLQILSGFDYMGKYQWSGGTLYDPKSGNTYRGRMTLVSKDRLDLRGYVIFSFFGRTSSWTRATEK